MSLDLVDYERQAREAVMAFWGNREKARQKQIEAGEADGTTRGLVLGGKNMDGFVALVIDLVQRNGLPDADFHRSKAFVTLPGYFRPTKDWDLLVMNKGRLVAAIELKARSARSATISTIEPKRRSAQPMTFGQRTAKVRWVARPSRS